MTYEERVKLIRHLRASIESHGWLADALNRHRLTMGPLMLSHDVEAFDALCEHAVEAVKGVSAVIGMVEADGKAIGVPKRDETKGDDYGRKEDGA
jgi:hypothetical protein